MRDVVIEVREPYARAAFVHFLTLACVPGVETLVDGVYARTLRLRVTVNEPAVAQIVANIVHGAV